MHLDAAWGRRSSLNFDHNTPQSTAPVSLLIDGKFAVSDFSFEAGMEVPRWKID